VNVQDDHVGRDDESMSLEALRDERDRLRAQLNACRHDLDQARLELAQARETQESLSEQLHTRAAGGDGVPVPYPEEHSGRASERPMGWWRRMRMSPEQRAMLEDADLVRASTWFDAEWYVTEYPDVANSGIDPAEHYLRHGAPEGRDPGPQFSTEAYLRDHPGLVASGANPLLHFIRSGRGRGA
jgi:hypothetical protein